MRRSVSRLCSRPWEAEPQHSACSDHGNASTQQPQKVLGERDVDRGFLHQPRDNYQFLFWSLPHQNVPLLASAGVDLGVSIWRKVCWDLWGFLYNICTVCLKRSSVDVFLTGHHLHQHSSPRLGSLQQQIAHTSRRLEERCVGFTPNSHPEESSISMAEREIAVKMGTGRSP